MKNLEELRVCPRCGSKVVGIYITDGARYYSNLCTGDKNPVVEGYRPNCNLLGYRSYDAPVSRYFTTEELKEGFTCKPLDNYWEGVRSGGNPVRKMNEDGVYE